MRDEYVRQFDQISRSYQGDDNDFFNHEYIMDSAFGQYAPRSKTDNPKTLQEEINKTNANGRAELQQAHTHVQNPMISEEEEFEHMIHHGINNLLETHSSHDRECKNLGSTHHSSQASVERINPSLRIKDEASGNSSVLRFEVKRELRTRYIYNLFSNFGNLSFISKKHNNVYVKFRTL